MQVVLRLCSDMARFSSIEAEHQSESGSVRVISTGHLSVNGHLHQGGTLAESTHRALDVYLKGGIDSLCDAISGEFALLVLDRTKLYLIADLCGIVPLYWGMTDTPEGETYIVVSTSLAEVAKTLRSIGGKRLQPNKTFLAAFIADVPHLLDANHQTSCPLEGIERVPGSFRVELDLSTEKKMARRYWDVNQIQTQQMDLPTAILRLSDALEASVQECFSHGRVAISLSGGIDSGSLAYYASEYSKSQCVCLTAGLDQWPEIDETSLAARTAKQLGLELHVVDCNKAFPFAMIEPRLVYQYGLPVNMFHEGERRRIEAARQLGAGVLIYGVGADELLGVGQTPGYIWDMVRSAKFGDALSHLSGWMRRLGVSPFGAISAARSSRDWSLPSLPPFLVNPQRLLEHLADTALHAPSRIKERVRLWNSGLTTSESWWTRAAICIPRNMKVLHPLLLREVVEASFAIPQWFIQHPDEYKWILKRIMHSKFPDMQFKAVPNGYGLIMQRGIRLIKDRLIDYFENSCRLVTHGIVTADSKDYLRRFIQDPDLFERSLGGSGYWLWNMISAEMWLRGFEEVEGT